METIILVVHCLIALALVGVVLLQRSEGGGLGIGGGGGGGGGMGNFMTARGTANLLTRVTAILAAAFFTTSIVLAILAGTHRDSGSLFSTTPGAEAPAEGLPDAPAAEPVPQLPSVPASE